MSSLEVFRTLCVLGALKELVCESDKPYSNSAWQRVEGGAMRMQ